MYVSICEDVHIHARMHSFIHTYIHSCYIIIRGLYLANAHGATGRRGDDRLRVILRTMSTHLESAKELSAAHEAIYGATYHNAFNAHILGKPCVNLIFECMRGHEKDVYLQTIGLQALICMILDEDNRSHVIEVSGMPKVMSSMRRHSTNAHARIKACEFFYNTFFEEPDFGANAIFFEIEGVKHIVWCMHTYKDDQDMCFIGCEMFAPLIYPFENGKNRHEIMGAGCNAQCLEYVQRQP